MEHFFGLQDRPINPPTGWTPNVCYDPRELNTAHLLLCGMSGSGKSFQIKKLLGTAARSGAQIEVFDVHEELQDIPGAVAVKYSQATKFGFNPLALETNIHSGGPGRQTDFLVNLIKQVSPQLGTNQESVLRNLCMDTYAAQGIFQDNPRSWVRREITEVERLRYISSKQFGELKSFYPTLEDLRSYALRKISILTIGGDQVSITAFHELAKLLKRLNSLTGRYAKAISDKEMEQLKTQIEETKTKTKDAHSLFIDNLETGKEMEDIQKYRSVEVLTSVVQRLDLLNTTGIFRSNPPPFGNTNVRIHQIKDITPEQRLLFIKLRLQAAFETCKRLGPLPEGSPPRLILCVEEANQIFTKDKGDVVNVIAREGRKFGLALWCLSQQPTDFPADYLTNCGAIVLCGVHPKYLKLCETMLAISPDTLSKIRPKEVMAVLLQKTKDISPGFVAVTVANNSTLMGKRVESVERSRGNAAA